MSNTTIVFNADTASFNRNLDAMRQQLLANGDAVSRVKAKILESLQQQTRAAQEAGRSQSELDRIQTRAAERLSIVTEQNAARQEQALDRLLAKQRAVAAEMERIPRAQAAGGHDISDRQAVSGAIRLGEGTNGIRAIESFIAMSPIAAKAFQTLFPLIGAAGLAGLLFEMGEQGYEAFEKIQHAARDTQRAFDEVHAKNIVSIDDLEIQNQKIQDQIDKLSGHPNNGVATALLEAKKRADELLVSLQSDRKEAEALFKEHSIGFFTSLATGQMGTGRQEKDLLRDYDQIEDELGNAKTPADRQKVFGRYSGQWASQIDALKKEQEDSKKAADAANAAMRGVAMGQYGATGATAHVVDNSGKISELKNQLRILQARATMDALGESIASGDEKLGGLKQKKEFGEADRKAMEAQRQAWKAEDAQREIDGRNSGFVEINVWDKRLSGLKAGSEQYIYAQEQLAGKLKEQRRLDTEDQKQAAEKALRSQRDSWDLMHDVWQTSGKRSAQDEADFWSIRVLEAEQGTENYRQALNKWTQAQNAADREMAESRKRQDEAGYARAQQRGAFDEAFLNLRRQQGQISPHDYSVQQANIHAQLYAAEQDALRKRLADAQATGTPAEADSASAAILKSQAERSIQVMQDAANIAAQTWRGALKNANADWVQDSRDSAKQVTELYSQALDGLNDNLSNLMLGKKSNLAGMFQSLGKTVGTDALKRVEAPILGALGVGKADGSAGNPFSVKIVGGFGGNAGAGWLGGLAGTASSATAGAGATGARGFFSKALGFVGTLLGGGRAVGGNVQAGVTYDVGEMGREEFTPSTNGTITPHDKVGGNVAYYSVQVANGVTPEQMNMHMRTALKEFHPVVVRDSVKAAHVYAQRNPSSRH